MRVLVTGGDGFIGSHLVQAFQSRGHSVDVVDIKSGTDVRNFAAKQTYGLCVHLAARCVIRECIADPDATNETNAMGTFNVLEQMRKTGCKQFVYFSSRRVLHEEKNVYTAAKSYGEELVQAYHQTYGLDYQIIRPSTVFGELDCTNRLVPAWIRNAFSGKPLELFGNGQKTLDLTYIRDFVQGFFLAIDRGKWNEDYTIANGKGVNLAELAQYIVQQSNSKSKIVFRDAEIAQPQQVECNIEKILELGYTQEFSWKRGIQNTMDWLKTKQA